MTDQKAPHRIPDEAPKPPTLHPGVWTFKNGDPSIRGIRIGSGRGNLFIADENVLPLAQGLADHLEHIKKKATR